MAGRCKASEIKSERLEEGFAAAPSDGFARFIAKADQIMPAG
jgi:hypothetical protein